VLIRHGLVGVSLLSGSPALVPGAERCKCPGHAFRRPRPGRSASVELATLLAGFGVAEARIARPGLGAAAAV